jgi:hypothetical protein
MKMKRAASVFSIFMGLSMLGMWTMFYLSGSIPELVTKPMEISMHIVAELLTAVMLIVGGIGVLVDKKWGRKIYFVSMGMLLYTLIVSPGYYIQRGNIGFVAMFAVFFVISIIFLRLMLSEDKP